jgi:hypothetical protein
MEKQKKFWGFLGKGALIILLPIIYSVYIVGLFKAQVWFAPSLAVILLVTLAITIVGILRYMPKPSFRAAIVPAFGLFGAYNHVDPSLQILILCFHIEIGMK